MVNKILFTLLLFAFFTTKCYGSESPIVIINQVRGSEQCCQPGNMQMFLDINNKYSDLPVGWAIRYDALLNKTVVNNLKQSHEAGLLLEITPHLASQSGVEYKGKLDGTDWYYAKNAFLIGYTTQERIKLVDTLFEAYRQVFGVYPQFTTSWMIDSFSLNYINDKYGVILHEITKEQYETDSYTLYGGVFNAAYFPSSNHPLIPTRNNPQKMVMIRQTISDPINNYGSPKAYFTSQPNDYLNSPDQKNIDYFNKLLKQNISQKAQQVVSVIGLENSFTQKRFINEFMSQLDIINNLPTNEAIVYRPSEFAHKFIKSYKSNEPFCIETESQSENIKEVIWYFTGLYRARVINKDNHLIIDDLRIYQDLRDPYAEITAETDYAYWIIPSIFDGSSQYSLNQIPTGENIYNFSSGNIVPDFISEPFGIKIGSGEYEIDCTDELIINYKDTNQKIVFTKDAITIDKLLNPQISLPYDISFNSLFDNQKDVIWRFNRHRPLYAKSLNNTLEFGWKSESASLPLLKVDNTSGQYVLKPQLISPQQQSYLTPIISPDRSNLKVDSNKSIFYWNNKTAVAGKNPLRLFILPQNSLGQPTKITSLDISGKFADIEISYPGDYNYKITPWFVDIYGVKPHVNEIKLTIDGETIFTGEKVEFVTNCKKEFLVCLQRPAQLFKYLREITTGSKPVFLKI